LIQRVGNRDHAVTGHIFVFQHSHLDELGGARHRPPC
jgi:hypothetical protein